MEINVNKRSKHSIVLDIDETMGRTIECLDKSKEVLKYFDKFNIFTDPNNLDIRIRSHRLIMDDPCTKRGEGDIMYCWMVERPGLPRFLDFCFDYFQTVNVWTAGRRSYGETISESLFSHVRNADHIFTRDDCKQTQKGCIKELEKMIQRHSDTGPINHLFLVDDNPVSFSHNKGNAIEIPPYCPNPTPSNLRENDTEFDKLIEWFSLDDVRCCDDITKLNKKNIFDYSVEEYRKGKYTVTYHD